MKTRQTCRWAFLLGICLSLNFAHSQESTKQDSEEVSDWVKQMPVSMNGKLPTGSLWRDGQEKKRWHNCVGGKLVREYWKMEEFFDDPDVIKLCDAISKSDIATMEKLIKSGVDVNAVGIDGMNPLYWAFHMDTDPRPFELLLKNGANPNQIVFNKEKKRFEAFVLPGGGFAVTHLVAFRDYNRQFKNVFEHGGDPNLVSKNFIRKYPPYRFLWPSTPDAVERVQLWIKKGAKLDKKSEDGMSFVCLQCIGGDEQSLRLCHLALKGGADYSLSYKIENKDFVYWESNREEYKGCYFRMIHFMAINEEKVRKRPKAEQKYYQRVLNFLEQRGESLKEAHADLNRWKALVAEGKQEVIEKEHQDRMRRKKARSNPAQDDQ